jgi:hypothetical protein
MRSPTFATVGATTDRTSTVRADHHPATISNVIATRAAASNRITAEAPVSRAIAALASQAPRSVPVPGDQPAGRTRPTPTGSDRRADPSSIVIGWRASDRRRGDPGQAVGDQFPSDLDADVAACDAVRERGPGGTDDVVGCQERPM